MSQIVNNLDLTPFNTFGFSAKAKEFVVAKDLSNLIEIIKKHATKRLLILGGGSNLLLINDFDGLVIKNEIFGKEIIKEDNDHVWIKVGAGEIWHDWVLYAIDHGWAGIENMSLIPGTVGAAPMQNIGAYGVEIKDVFECLEALNKESLEVEVFDKEACQFGYRESVFKHQAKYRYVIVSVTFKLSKNPDFKISYGDIQKVLDQSPDIPLSIKSVSDAIIQIRRSKLPDPAEIGNSGSFFKNPEIPTEQFNVLKTKYENIPGYIINDTSTKVPAGWLIEQAGWKGKTIGHVGVHTKQALVLVHFGGGKGQEIVDLSKQIQESVFQKFGIRLQPEVNFVY